MASPTGVRGWLRRAVGVMGEAFRKRGARRALVAGVALAGIVLLGLLLWRGPWILDRSEFTHPDRPVSVPQATTVSGFRTALAALIVATAGAVGLYFTSRTLDVTRQTLEHTRTKDREASELAREGQVTDRYVKAVGLLTTAGEDAVTARLAGVYALQRIMFDSPKDHDTVVQLLAAFVRERSPWPPKPAPALPDPDPFGPLQPKKLAHDVQAALTVLATRPERDEREPVDLSEADLSGAHLPTARLDRAVFRGSRLDRAYLAGAKLSQANFYRASMRSAVADGADLFKAYFDEADLASADLTKANLRGAWMRKAQLQGTYLRAADLTDTWLHDAELINPNGTWMAVLDGPQQLLDAKVTSSTRLHSSLADDPDLAAHIEKCTQEYITPQA